MGINWWDDCERNEKLILGHFEATTPAEDLVAVNPCEVLENRNILSNSALRIFILIKYNPDYPKSGYAAKKKGFIISEPFELLIDSCFRLILEHVHTHKMR